jgi:short-subunit dehydrogenase
VSVHTADLAEAASAEQLAGSLASDGVTVDVLINNAGVGSHNRFVDQDPDTIGPVIQLNCVSLVALTRQLLPGMVTRRRGGIMNVASTAGFQPVPTMAVCAATKAFVLSFTEAPCLERMEPWQRSSTGGGGGCPRAEGPFYRSPNALPDGVGPVFDWHP